MLTTNTVVIGSAVYNGYTRLLERRGLTHTYFSYADVVKDASGRMTFSVGNPDELVIDRPSVRGFRFNGGENRHDLLMPGRVRFLNALGKPELDQETGATKLDASSKENAVLEKFQVEGKTIILCAGTSSNATFNAVYYLLNTVLKRKDLLEADAFALHLIWTDLPKEEENCTLPPKVTEHLRIMPTP